MSGSQTQFGGVSQLPNGMMMRQMGPSTLPQQQMYPPNRPPDPAFDPSVVNGYPLPKPSSGPSMLPPNRPPDMPWGGSSLGNGPSVIDYRSPQEPQAPGVPPPNRPADQNQDGLLSLWQLMGRR
jgi:hypothetical protein